ncbi:AAA family ATPase, partial [Brachyspira innocens]|nr:AAA family ATPase [Brachyspira innocens]MDO7021390.1 AAA family ATPase [Brachyspira innocens]
MSDKHGKISVFVYISILINIIVLALFITFVFGLKKDAFDVDTKKLDRNALICQNSIVSLVKDYDDRLNKIVESYPFINLLQQVILNGIDEAERDRIISIFRSGNYPFDTVALYLADGKSVFSSPVKTKPVDLESYKKSNARAFFDKDYDGVYFVKPIRNDRGIEVGYIVASVFKKIFENTSYNLNFVVLPNGVVYHNPSIDINSISRDSLTQYMDKDIGSSGTIDVDNNTFTFYSSKVKDIDNFSIGILELNVPIIQKYLKYIILALLALSSLFLITTSLLERNKSNNEEEEEDNEEDKEDENIYDESEPPINNYDNANIVNDEEFNIDDYDIDAIDSLDDDSIKYFNNKRDRITKANKVDLPDIDDVEDIEIKKDNDDNDESLKLDDVLEEDKKEDESIKIGDLSSLDDVLEDGGETVKDDEEDNNDDNDESLKLGDLSSLDDVLEEDKKEDESIKIGDLSSLDGIANDEDFDEVPNLDDIINDEEDNKEEDNKDDDTPEMKEYTNEELLDADNIVDDDEDEDVPNLDDIINDEDDNKEEDNKDDDTPEMKEYT